MLSSSDEQWIVRTDLSTARGVQGDSKSFRCRRYRSVREMIASELSSMDLIPSEGLSKCGCCRLSGTVSVKFAVVIS